MSRNLMASGSRNSLQRSVSSISGIGSSHGGGRAKCDELVGESSAFFLSGNDAVKPMRRELVVHKPAGETFGKCHSH